MNRLAQWLHETGTSQGTFAALIGAHQTQISRYVNGKRPSPRIRKVIEEATKGAVPAKSWDRPILRRPAA